MASTTTLQLPPGLKQRIARVLARTCRSRPPPVVALGCALLFALPAAANAAERYSLVFDPTLTGQMGARDLSSAVRLADRGLDALLDEVLQDRDALAASARLGRALLADLPLTIAVIVVQHEVFGHGYRGREHGLAASYRWLPQPSVWVDQSRLSASEDAVLIAEGQHAEELLVHELEREALLSGQWERLAEAVAMGRAAVGLGRLLKGQFAPQNDWARYKYWLSGLPNAWRHAEPWKNGAQWLLDPVVLWSAYDYFLRHLLWGERAGPLPTLRLGASQLLARSAFRMAPWGEELGVLGYLAWPAAVAEAQLLVGASDGVLPLHFSIGGTWREIFPRLDLGARAELWTEPRYAPVVGLVFPSTVDPGSANAPPSTVPTRAFGGLIELELAVRIVESVRPRILAGTKSEGFVVGRPWSRTVYVQAGVDLAF